MSATLSLRLEGAAELSRALRALPAATGGSILQGAVRSGAELLAHAITTRAAGAFTSRSGKLLRSAKAIDVVSQTTASVEILVGPRAPHSHLVERGHRLVARGSRRGRGRVIGVVRGRPFVHPAFEATRQLIVDLILGTLKKSIEETMALRSFGVRRPGRPTR